jgi:hypothetical protein
MVAPLGRETQASEAVNDELKEPKANSFAEGEATAPQTLTISGDDDF